MPTTAAISPGLGAAHRPPRQRAHRSAIVTTTARPGPAHHVPACSPNPSSSSSSNVAANTSLGVDRKTVRKYTAPAGVAGIAPGGPPMAEADWRRLVCEWFPELSDTRLRQRSWPAIEAHRDYIAEQLKVGVTAATIYQRLADEQGLRASVASLRRWVRANLPEDARRGQVTVLRETPPPGEEAQVDYGRLGMWLDPRSGRRRTVWVFAGGARALAAPVRAAHAVIRYGPVGVGKTHIAQALGHLAIRADADVHFLKTSPALAELAGGPHGTRTRRLRELARPAVLVLDDFAMRELTPHPSRRPLRTDQRTGHPLPGADQQPLPGRLVPCSPTPSSPSPCSTG